MTDLPTRLRTDAESVSCPRCGAGPGRRCQTSNGYWRPPHASRVKAAEPSPASSLIVKGEIYTSDLVFQGTRLKDEEAARLHMERTARAKARRASSPIVKAGV